MNDHIPLEDLSAWIDDQLAPARREQVDAHIATCAKCREQLESLRWSVGLTRAMPKTPLPPGASLRVPVEERSAPGWRRLLGQPVLLWVGAAAVIAVAIGLSAGGLLLFGARGVPDDYWSAAVVEQSTYEELDAEGAADGEQAADAVGVAMAPELGQADADQPELAGNVAGDGAEQRSGSEPSAETVGAAAVPREPAGTADIDVGYPEPLSSARAEDARERGFLPPAEIAVDQPEPDITALALAQAPGAAEGEAASVTAAEEAVVEQSWLDAAEEGVEGEAAGAAGEAVATEGEAIVTEGEAAATEGEATGAERLGARPEMGGAVHAPAAQATAQVTDEGAAPAASGAANSYAAREGASGAEPSRTPWALPLMPTLALVAVLLSLSALLYVRARR
ncbi:MAG: anti-sigma factor family protein [Anaerolineae bacterium]